MAKYKKRPVIIEAIQWTGQDSYEQVKEFAGDAFICWHTNHDTLSLQTLEGVMVASLGDWIIKGVKSEVYSCRDDIFRMTYEPVEEEAVA